jgi:hypothetical protein
MPSSAASRAMLCSSRKAETGLFDGELKVLAHFVAAQHAADPQRDAGLSVQEITQALGGNRNLIGATPFSWTV